MHSTTTRSPAGSLRDRHAATTRGLILDAFAAQLAERGPFEVGYYELARRAGVSVRTLYRHFPARRDLLEGLARRVNALVAFDYPRTRDGIAAAARSVFAIFDRNATLITAQLHAGQATVRTRGRRRRTSAMEAALPHLPPERRRAAAGLLTCLFSAHVWQRLRDDVGLDGPAAGEIAGWAIDTLWRALEAEHDRARRR